MIFPLRTDPWNQSEALLLIIVGEETPTYSSRKVPETAFPDSAHVGSVYDAKLFLRSPIVPAASHSCTFA